MKKYRNLLKEVAGIVLTFILFISVLIISCFITHGIDG
jgi:hypothetical protein